MISRREIIVGSKGSNHDCASFVLRSKTTTIIVFQRTSMISLLTCPHLSRSPYGTKEFSSGKPAFLSEIIIALFLFYCFCLNPIVLRSKTTKQQNNSNREDFLENFRKDWQNSLYIKIRKEIKDDKLSYLKEQK